MRTVQIASLVVSSLGIVAAVTLWQYTRWAAKREKPTPRKRWWRR